MADMSTSNNFRHLSKTAPNLHPDYDDHYSRSRKRRYDDLKASRRDRIAESKNGRTDALHRASRRDGQGDTRRYADGDSRDSDFGFNWLNDIKGTKKHSYDSATQDDDLSEDGDGLGRRGQIRGNGNGVNGRNKLLAVRHNSKKLRTQNELGYTQKSEHQVYRGDYGESLRYDDEVVMRSDYDRRNSTASSVYSTEKRPSWIGMANSSLMNNWNIMFGKMRPRWAPDGYTNGPATHKSRSAGSELNEETRQIRSRVLPILAVCLLILLLIAVLVPVLVLVVFKEDDVSKNTVTRVTMHATIDNVNYIAEMANDTSAEFWNFSGKFCDQIDMKMMASDLKNVYIGCAVDSLSSGSVISKFFVVTNTSAVKERIVNVIKAGSKADVVEIGNFRVRSNSIVAGPVNVIDRNKSPVPIRVTYNSTCNTEGVGNGCATPRAICINKTCTCPSYSYYVPATSSVDSCEQINCGPLPAVTNGSISQQSTGTAFMDNFTLTCNDGFEMPTGDSTVSCQTHGTWGTVPLCTPIECPEYTPLSNYHIEDNTTLSQAYNTKIKIECKVGYEMLSGDSDIVICQLNKTWSPGPTCSIVNCSEFIIPKNGGLEASSTEGNTFGANKIVVCNEGYEISETESDTSTCQANGTWSQIPTCAVINCPDFTIPENGTTDTSSTEGNTFGANRTVICNKGFEISENEPNYSTCQANGAWSEIPTCTIISCPQFQAPENSKLDDSSAAENTFGANKTVNCDEGYEMSDDDSETVTCQADKAWSPNPSCTIVSCEAFQFPNNSEETISIGNMYGENTTIKCKPGYILDGPSTVSCQADKNWSESGTCDPIPCDEFTYPNNSVKPNNSNSVSDVTFGTEIYISCETGFLLIGESPLSCDTNGDWRNIRCEAVDCNTTDFLKQVNADIKNGNATWLEISCKKGFLIEGNPFVTCVNGSWSENPKCSTVYCQQYANVAHGNVTYFGEMSYGNTLEITCDTGYKHEEVDTITCLETGQWSHNVTCATIDCGMYTPPKNGYVMDENTSMIYDTKLTVFCDEGFNMEGESQVRCDIDEEWSTSPVCEPVSCGAPDKVINGEVISDETNSTFNSSVKVTCKVGYDLNGEEIITCQSNGEWTLYPKCNPVDCESFALPENMIIVSEGGTTFQEEIELGCTEGYTLDSEDSIITCLADRTWSASPDCTIVQCGQASAPENGNIEELNGTSFRSVANVTCDSGFSLVGKDAISCMSSGNWETIPVCTIVACGNLDPPINSKVNLSMNNYLIACDDGYVLNGDPQINCGTDNKWIINGTCEPMACPFYSSPDNGNVTSRNTAFVFKDIITVVCNNGYEFSDSSLSEQSAKCQSDGNWNASYRCKKVDCGVYTTPTNSHIGDNLETTYGSKIVVTCDTGYKSLDEMTVSCEESGDWSQSPACEPVDCGEPGTVANGSIIENEIILTTFNNSITIECNEGYYADGDSISTCQSDETWTKFPYCKKEKLAAYTIQATLTNSTYTEAMGDKTSPEFWKIAGPVCDEMDALYANSTNYKGCSVKLSNGSVIVEVTVFVLSSGGVLQASSTVEVFFTGEDNNADFTFAGFIFVRNPATVVVVANITEEQISVPKRVTYNSTCNTEGVGNGCATPRAICINKTCTCPSYSYYVPATSSVDSCEQINCGPLPAVTNGSISQQSTGTAFMDNFTLTCDDGFEISTGDSTVTCQTHGTWGTVPSCTPIECPEYTPLSNYHIEDNTTSSQAYNVKIKIECKVGYEMLSGDSDTVICQLNKTWSPGPTCSIVNCSEFIIPKNGGLDASSTEGNTFGGNKIVVCDEGYEISETESDTSTCQANGTWSQIPTCAVINCPDFTIPENGTIDTSPTEGNTFGANKTVICNKGFEISENEPNYSTCQANGTWSQIPTCAIISCPEFTIPENSILDTSPTDGNTFGANRTVVCNEGWEISENESDSSTCQANGAWSEIPTCTIISCPQFQAPENSKLDDSSAAENTFGANKTVNCDEGYEMSEDDSETVTCQADKAWSPNPSCTIVSCQAFQFPNNSEETISIGNKYGENTTIECKPGYILNGSSTVSCQADKNWSESGTCDPITCDEFTYPNNSVKPNNSNSVSDVKFGTEIYISCETGFLLIGESPLSCDTNGDWRNITCEAVDCNTTDFLKQVNGDIKNGNATWLEISCKKGFVIEGNPFVTCVNGSWSESPKCNTVNCQQYANVAHGNVTYFGEMSYGNTLEITCDTGYKHEEVDTITCLETGQWSHNVTCATIDCGMYTPPKNGYVIDENTSMIYDTKLTVFCDEGFNIEGESQVRCDIDEEWSTSPVCEPVSCGAPDKVINGEVISDEEDTTFNSSVKVTCKVGYDLNGEEIITCQSNGEWTLYPQCNPVDCESFALPENMIIVSEGGTTFQEEIELGCTEGYTLDSEDSIITCLADRNWSASPNCTIVQCGQASAPENGNIEELNGTSFRSVANVTCNSGFSLVGKDAISCMSSGNWETIPVCTIVDCGNLDPSINGKVNLSMNNYLIACDDGYVLNGDPQINCGTDNKWIINGTCEPMACPSYSSPDNGNVTSRNTAFVFKDIITVVCDNGYAFSDSSLSEQSAKCQSDGTWNASYRCVKVDCGVYTTPTNSHIGDNLETTYGSKIVVTCDTGYKSYDEMTVSCEESGNWSQNPACEPVDCGEPGTVANGSIIENENVLTTFNNSITIECNEGYYADGGLISTCQSDETWTKFPECKKEKLAAYTIQATLTNSTYTEAMGDKTSPEFWEIAGPVCDEMNKAYANSTNYKGCSVELSNGSVIVEVTVFVLSSGGVLQASSTVEVFFTGEDSNADFTFAGFIFVRNPATVVVVANITEEQISVPKRAAFGDSCTTNGVGNGCATSNAVCTNSLCTCPTNMYRVPASDECQPIDCGEVPEVANGIAQDPTGSGYLDTFLVTCNDGYETPTGLSEVEKTCKEHGTWGEVPSCSKKVTCSPFNDSFIQIDGDEIETPEFNDVLNVSCIPGYTTSDDSALQVTCQSNKEWSDVNCEPITCTDDVAPIDGSIESSADNGDRYGEKTSVNCNTGYVLQGDSIRTCQFDGSWSGDPVCNAVECSIGSVHLENGQIDDEASNVFTYGENVTYVCNDGYVISGVETVTCQADGTWSGQLECIKVECGEFISPDNSIKLSSSNDSVSLIECKSGYELQGVNYARCELDGTWSETGMCNAIMCGVFKYPNNSIAPSEGTTGNLHFGDLLNVSCEVGYTLIGNPTISCDDMSSWGEVECSIIECDEYKEDIEYGYTTGTDGTTFGSTVQVKCDVGFELIGLDILRCTEDGTWEDAPTCKLIDCGKPDNLEHGTLEYSSTYYSSSVFAECDNGYTPNGKVEINCTVDQNGETITGKWSEYPSCDIVDCNVYIPPVHSHVVNSNSTTYGSTLTVECEDGYSLYDAEQTSVICGNDGEWTGIPDLNGNPNDEPVCTTIGSISFSSECFLLVESTTGHVTCEFAEAQNWRSIMILKENEPIAIISENNGTYEPTTMPSHVGISDVSSMDTNSATVVLEFSPVNNNDEGRYFCAVATVVFDLSSGELPGKDQSKTASTYVAVLNKDESVPAVAVSPIDETDDDVTIRCESFVDQTDDGKELTLQVKQEGSEEFINITDNVAKNINDTACPVHITIEASLSIDSTWNNTLVRCVQQTEGGQLVSADVTIVIPSPGTVATTTSLPGTPDVKFADTSITAFIGDSVIIECTATSIEGISEIALSKDGDDVSKLTNDGSNDYMEGFVSDDSVISESGGSLKVNITSAKCADKGEYICKAVGSNTTKETTAMVSLEQSPSLVLNFPAQIREDRWTLNIQCEAVWGIPGRNLTFLLKRADEGVFMPYVPEVKKDVELRWKTELMDGNCTEKVVYEFDMDTVAEVWNNTEIQCALDYDTKDEIRSEIGVFKIVPKSVCTDVDPNTNIVHPFDCTRRIKCTGKAADWSYIFQTSCGGDEGSCWISGETEADLVCGNITTTSTTPTTTTTTTTPAPGTPWIDCPDPSKTSHLGDDVVFVCHLRDIESVTSIKTINDNGDKIYEDTNEQGVAVPIVLGDITMMIENDQLNVSFSNVSCDLEGSYTTWINNETHDEITLRVISDPGIPLMGTPPLIYNDQQTEISCSAEVGRDEKGEPIASIDIEVMPEGESQYTAISEGLTRDPLKETDCILSETVRLCFYAEKKWNNSAVRCALKSTTTDDIAVSDPFTILTLPSNVFFTKPFISAFIGESIIIECTASVPGLSQLRLTRGENCEDVFAITADGSSKNNISGIAVVEDESSITGSEGHLKIKILSAVCADKGSYICEAVGEQNSFEVLLIVSLTRKSVRPELDVSSDIIENKVQWGGFPTSCKGQVGDTSSTLVLESDVSGSYKELDATVTYDTDNETCSVVATVNYYNTDPYNMDWDNTNIRCRVNDADTAEVDISLSVIKPVRVVPVSFCENEEVPKDTKVEHPYACYTLITCQTDGSQIVPYEACEDHDKCWSGSACVSCEIVDKCITGIHPTTTTTLAPGTPTIQCTDSTTSAGETAEFACILNNANINIAEDSSVRINHGESVVFNSETNGDGTAVDEGVKFDITPGTSVIIGNTTITVMIDPVECDHAGEYAVHYTQGSIELADTSTVDITADATSPVLTPNPAVFYRDQENTITCVGNLGKPRGNTDMSLKKMSSGGNMIYEVIGDVTTKETDNDECAENKTITYTFTVKDDHDGDEVMCETITDNGTKLTSSPLTINVEEPVLSFDKQEVSTLIGEPVNITCTLAASLGALVVVIKRESTQQEVARKVVVDDKITEATLNVAEAVCTDEGRYICEAEFSDGSAYITGAQILVTKTQGTPILTLPTKLVAGEKTQFGSDHLTCTADVGHPPGRVSVKYRKENGSEYESFQNMHLGTAKSDEEVGNCSSIKSESYHWILFTSEWNNAKFRCDVYDGNDELHGSTQDQTIQLIANTCKTDGDGYYLHPYDCHSYKWCHSNGTLAVASCGNICPDIREANQAVSCVNETCGILCAR